MRPILLLVTSVFLAAGAAACGNDSTTTTSPSSTTSPTTVTFTSQLVVHGSASRSFTMSSAGTVNLTLATLGNGALTAGVGVGVLASGSPCSLAESVVTGPGTSPQISLNADAGSYCIQIWDPGTLTEDTPFSMTVEHP